MRKGVAAFVADWLHTEGLITEVNILGIMGPRLLAVGEGNYKMEKIKYRVLSAVLDWNQRYQCKLVVFNTYI